MSQLSFLVADLARLGFGNESLGFLVSSFTLRARMDSNDFFV